MSTSDNRWGRRLAVRGGLAYLWLGVSNIGLSAEPKDLWIEKTDFASIEGRGMQIDFNLGLVKIQEASTPTTRIGAAYNFAVQDDVTVGVSLGYWRKAYDRLDNGTVATIDVDDVIVGLKTEVYFPMVGTDVVPQIGFGVSTHRLSLKTVTATGPERIAEVEQSLSETGTQAAVGIEVGFVYPMKESLDFTTRIEYTNILEDAVKFDQVAISGGLAYRI